MDEARRAALDAELTEVRNRATAAAASRARAQVERERATGAAQAARERLAAEFGVRTAEEAQAAQTALEAEVEAALTAARDALARAGA